VSLRDSVVPPPRPLQRARIGLFYGSKSSFRFFVLAGSDGWDLKFGRDDETVYSAGRGRLPGAALLVHAFCSYGRAADGDARLL